MLTLCVRFSALRHTLCTSLLSGISIMQVLNLFNLGHFVLLHLVTVQLGKQINVCKETETPTPAHKFDANTDGDDL
jgi:hypothetical protein